MLKRIAEKKRRAMIPERFKDASFKNFDLSLYRDQETAKYMYDAILTWFNLYNTPLKKIGGWMYVFSQAYGSGKTRMACSILNELIERYQISSFFITSAEILKEIKASWSEGASGESELIDKLSRIPILVIDDFGAEKVSEWVNDKIFTVINERYEENRMTIFTSNHPIGSLPYDKRISTRLTETCNVIFFPEECIRSGIGNNLNRELYRQVKREGDMG